MESNSREPSSLSSTSSQKLYSLFESAAKRKSKAETEDEWEVSLASLAEKENTQSNERRRPGESLDLPSTKRILKQKSTPPNDQDTVADSTTGIDAPVLPLKEEKKPPKPDKTPQFSRVSFLKPSALRSSNNIVLQLLHRSTTVARCARTIRVQPPPSCWTIPSSVSLDSSSRMSTVSSLAWDSLGVLLAVATSQKQIKIFDWDVVVAADMKHRRLRARESVESQPCRIAPSWSFSAPFLVSYICWNPDCPDQLAVAFRGTSKVRVYDIASVAEPVCSRRGALHTAAWLGLDPSSNVAPTSGARSLLFLPRSHLLVSHTDGHLILWKVPSNTSTAARQPQWSFHSKEEISTMASLSSDFVLLGGTTGKICLLNWRKCSRKAFSTRVTPTVVGQWDTLQLIQMPSLSLPPRSWMGIQKFHVGGNATSCSMPKTASTTWAAQTLSWVTSCGWVLSMELLDPLNHMTSPCVSVLQTSPTVRLQRTDGEELDTKTTVYSLPSDATPADSMTNCVCWRQVPQTIRILPHHDKKVLDASSMVGTVSTAENSGFIWLNATTNVTTTIQLPKRYGSAKVLAVHPGREWIVFACDNKLRILSLRAK